MPDTDWSEKTQCGYISPDLGWRVYRVKTRNSEYTVALRLTGKRVGALRGTSSHGGNIDMRDTDPTVGGSSAFEVPVGEWIGKALDFAGITTSSVVSIVPETDLALIAT